MGSPHETGFVSYVIHSKEIIPTSYKTFKRFTSIHERLFEQLHKRLIETRIHKYVTNQSAALIEKDGRGKIEGNYKLITHLHLTWKILTGQFAGKFESLQS